MTDFTIMLSALFVSAIIFVGEVWSNAGTPYSITRNVSQLVSYNAKMIETGEIML